VPLRIFANSTDSALVKPPFWYSNALSLTPIGNLGPTAARMAPITSTRNLERFSDSAALRSHLSETHHEDSHRVSPAESTFGLGIATAKLFAHEGADVFITGRRQEALNAAVAEIGPRAMGVQGDVSNLNDLDRLVVAIKAKGVALDILFANAGGTLAPIADVTEEHYHQIFDTNVKGVVFTVQKLLPLIKDGGSIILNSSIAGSMGMDSFSMYSGAKAAIRNFARGWANDLKSRRIRVNAISPGVVITPGYSGLGMNDNQIKEYAAQSATKTPSGRTGEPEEIAKAVLFLASNDSSFVNAENLVVDGGFSLV
jgi:NAD(P)-dependent dehydrogenase (short-subunit alcohol dehydrogenase family)